MKLIKNKFGFSLVELSISLVVIGVVLLGVMASLQSISKGNAAIKTETRLTKFADTVSNLSLGVRLLPAKATLDSNTVEQDAYGNNFNYFPAKNIALGISPIPANASRICEATNTNLSIVVRENGAPDKTIRNVAYVVSSNGSNLTREVNAANADTQLIVNTSSSDDIYKYVSLYELKERIGCPPPEPLKIISQYLPPIIGADLANRNMIFTSFGEKLSQFCIQAENTQQANLINANLSIVAVPNIRTPNTYNTLPNIKTEGCSNLDVAENGRFTVSTQALRVIPRAGANPGTYKFRVEVKEPGARYIADDHTFVQTITVAIP